MIKNFPAASVVTRELPSQKLRRLTVKKKKPTWLNFLNRLDMAAKIYRIARFAWEIITWFTDKVSQVCIRMYLIPHSQIS